MSEPVYPGTAAPDRRWSFMSAGLRLNVLEWGDPRAAPAVLCHGMWDHARSFALLAPLLASCYRVIALDARGHGDSEWADAYTWVVEVLDLLRLLRALPQPAHLIGHSKGGGQATDAALLAPGQVRKLVNLDGFGPPPFTPEQMPTPSHCAGFLDIQRGLARRSDWRPYPDLEALVERRRAQNPRLSPEWLRYFAYHGARRTARGWSWKSDPHMSQSFGPWRPEWIAESYPALRVPMLAVTGSEPDTWGPLPPAILAPRLARIADVTHRTVTGAGHFMHIERPAETARLVLDFLAS
jgi:pimeloyl-ACP methyl ester carboxylesterase